MGAGLDRGRGELHHDLVLGSGLAEWAQQTLATMNGSLQAGRGTRLCPGVLLGPRPRPAQKSVLGTQSLAWE